MPGLASIRKAGWLFILERVTGRPIFGVEERAVPKGNVQASRHTARGSGQRDPTVYRGSNGKAVRGVLADNALLRSRFPDKPLPPGSKVTIYVSS